MSDATKDKINSLFTPVLIGVIGFFLIQTLNQISTDIQDLQEVNKERDDWIREWTEEWQPVLDWAKHQKDK